MCNKNLWLVQLMSLCSISYILLKHLPTNLTDIYFEPIHLYQLLQLAIYEIKIQHNIWKQLRFWMMVELQTSQEIDFPSNLGSLCHVLLILTMQIVVKYSLEAEELCKHLFPTLQGWEDILVCHMKALTNNLCYSFAEVFFIFLFLTVDMVVSKVKINSNLHGMPCQYCCAYEI